MQLAKKHFEEFENKTSLVPGMVAQCVLEEVERHIPGVLGTNLQTSFQKRLSYRIVEVFLTNKNFQSKLKSGKGRDFAYSFMRHWVSAYIREQLGTKVSNRLPHGFSNGIG